MLNSILGKIVADNQRDWCERAPIAAAAYRASVHEATGFTPNRLMLGREVNAPLDVLLGTPPGGGERFSDVDEYVDQRFTAMKEIYEAVRQHLGVAASRRKRCYDVRVKPCQFRVGQSVYYYYPRRYAGRTPKWQRTYTPYEIVRLLPPTNAVLRKGKKGSEFVVHVDKLKPVYDQFPCDLDLDEATGPNGGVPRQRTAPAAYQRERSPLNDRAGDSSSGTEAFVDLGGREVDAQRPRDPPHALLPGENLAFCEPETGKDPVTTLVHADIPRPRRNRRAPRRFLNYEMTSSVAVSCCVQERTLMQRQRPTPTAGHRCRCCTERFPTLEGQHAHERRVHLGLGELINATIAAVTERPEETEEPLTLRHRVDAAVTCLLANILTCGARGMAARVRQTSPVLSAREAEIVVAAGRRRRKDCAGLASHAGGATAAPDRRGGPGVVCEPNDLCGHRTTLDRSYDAWSAICRTGGRRHAA